MRLEHKPTATADLIAVIAMLLATLAIVWAHVALYGIADIEDALSGGPYVVAAGDLQHAEAVVRNRWIAGFTQ